jgi:hypothetical protein
MTTQKRSHDSKKKSPPSCDDNKKKSSPSCDDNNQSPPAANATRYTPTLSTAPLGLVVLDHCLVEPVLERPDLARERGVVVNRRRRELLDLPEPVREPLDLRRALPRAGPRLVNLAPQPVHLRAHFADLERHRRFQGLALFTVHLGERLLQLLDLPAGFADFISTCINMH